MDNFRSFVSELKTQSVYNQTEERRGAEPKHLAIKRSPVDPKSDSSLSSTLELSTALHPLRRIVQTGVCSAIPVTPAADPGGQHDLPLPSGHPAALACGSPSPLSRPRLHIAAGGGRRCRPAEVSASLPREQPLPLGEYTAECLLRLLLCFCFISGKHGCFQSC